MRPFNIEEAIAHPKRVRLVHFATARVRYIAALGDNVAIEWSGSMAPAACVYLAGMLGLTINKNLRLADLVVERWVNIYNDGGAGVAHVSRKAADEMSRLGGSVSRIACVRITIDNDNVTATVEPINGDVA